MTYTKIQFGIELKEILKKIQDLIKIGEWAFSAYWDHIEDIENGVRKIALNLGTLELGSEFEKPYRILDKIADDLIAGKDIDLNAKEYRE